MKRFYLILMVLVASLSVSAQSIKLYKNGHVAREMDISAVDSVVYCPGDDESLPLLGYYGYISDNVYKTFSEDGVLTASMIEAATKHKIRSNVSEVRGPQGKGHLITLTKEYNSPLVRFETMGMWSNPHGIYSISTYYHDIYGTDCDNFIVVDGEKYCVWIDDNMQLDERRVEITLNADYGFYYMSAKSEEEIANLKENDFIAMYSDNIEEDYTAGNYIVLLTPDDKRPSCYPKSGGTLFSEGTSKMGKTKTINGKTYYLWYTVLNSDTKKLSILAPRNNY